MFPFPFLQVLLVDHLKPVHGRLGGEGVTNEILDCITDSCLHYDLKDRRREIIKKVSTLKSRFQQHKSLQCILHIKNGIFRAQSEVKDTTLARKHIKNGIFPTQSEVKDTTPARKLSYFHGENMYFHNNNENYISNFLNRNKELWEHTCILTRTDQ